MHLDSKNEAWLLGRKPLGGWPTNGDFKWVTQEQYVPHRGQALTRTLYLSMDPYQWGRRRSGAETPGDVCHGRTVSEVIASRSAEYGEGDIVFNTNGWQQFGLVGAEINVFGYMFPRILDANAAPISTAVGILGMLGLTAYSGIYLQCRPRPGETVVVSAASGGVGQAAGQIARIMGCRVVGIAGRESKCQFVTEELGFDACVSHLSPVYTEDLRKACPDGIDAYFENVGGSVYEGVLPLLNSGSRITLCGMISQYGDAQPERASERWHATGASFFQKQNVTVHPLFVRNFVDQHQAAFLEAMSAWIQDGLVRYREDLWVGLENAPEAFEAMLKGKNFGKTLVRVAPDPTSDDRLEAGRSNGNVLVV